MIKEDPEMSEDIGQSVQPSSYAMVLKPVKKRRVKKIIGYVVVAFVVLVVGLTFFANSATKAPVAASNQFLTAFQAGDATTAYSLFSIEAKAAVPADQFDAVVKQVAPILNGNTKMASKKVNGSTGSAATAEVIYDIPGSDGKTYTFTVNLTKENSVWKILNFLSKAQ
jgi:cytoskeletal protein RodZ